jgi:hypothetical protein
MLESLSESSCRVIAQFRIKSLTVFLVRAYTPQIKIHLAKWGSLQLPQRAKANCPAMTSSAEPPSRPQLAALCPERRLSSVDLSGNYWQLPSASSRNSQNWFEDRTNGSQVPQNAQPVQRNLTRTVANPFCDPAEGGTVRVPVMQDPPNTPNGWWSERQKSLRTASLGSLKHNPFVQYNMVENEARDIVPSELRTGLHAEMNSSSEKALTTAPPKSLYSSRHLHHPATYSKTLVQQRMQGVASAAAALAAGKRQQLSREPTESNPEENVLEAALAGLTKLATQANQCQETQGKARPRSPSASANHQETDKHVLQHRSPPTTQGPNQGHRNSTQTSTNPAFEPSPKNPSHGARAESRSNFQMWAEHAEQQLARSPCLRGEHADQVRAKRPYAAGHADQDRAKRPRVEYAEQDHANSLCVRAEHADQDRAKRPWTFEEDELVRDYVERFGPTKWTHIAAQLPGRVGKQCRERWVVTSFWKQLH